MSPLSMLKIAAIGVVAWWSGAAVLFGIDEAFSHGLTGALGAIIMAPFLALFGWPYLFLSLFLTIGLYLLRNWWCPTSRWASTAFVFLGTCIGAIVATLQVGLSLADGLQAGFWMGSLTAGTLASMLILLTCRPKGEPVTGPNSDLPL